ncbi:ATPase component of Mn/Zn ABC-type transporter [Candidatus Nitrososphaera evergladensis SR1]|uniref:ATPase component of Mn/Zn ABC-type transporter n=1 Tax=Candidatus Nitrososphaera evergladensis SR1 TaxID=1459636 RepID=A0A075MMP8_9ARCH|nr:metal ABC transporter ATP-binding protein [Candidatus Nitrososphaera evergladensis]AIF82117.1 ATPase component of Mn/Zn ABC-type transporter [Candidatus Nitrososphaera evergladensis SR1]
MHDAVVELEGVSFSYGGTLVLDNITFAVEKGDLLGMIGPNGAGKTTLFSCMLGLLGGYRGTIRIFGEDIKGNSRVFQRIGYIPQRKNIDSNFPATLEEIVSLGIGKSKKGKSDEERIASALGTVGLLALKDRRIGELSGGQQQRVLIAKAIVNEPELLILDEPATGIDLETQNRFYALLKKLNQEQKITIIWSSHDLDAVNKLASRVACVNRSMFFHGETHEFFENPDLLKAYSESSMQAHMHMHDQLHQHDH